ncbi:hypothetical protein ACJRO7_017265 [Eucalyptus globulus]|uniref:Uncharacterized protein n=1 Tax=Eucalyptus globulus TaxID=34317 RepID=A0ABD3L0X1_EUCGL
MDLTSIISILVNIIQVDYQGKSISPFETHPVATRIAICSLLLHFFFGHVANRAPLSSGRAPSCDGAVHLLFHFIGVFARVVATPRLLPLRPMVHAVPVAFYESIARPHSKTVCGFTANSFS